MKSIEKNISFNNKKRSSPLEQGERLNQHPLVSVLTFQHFISSNICSHLTREFNATISSYQERGGLSLRTSIVSSSTIHNCPLLD